MGFSFNGWKVLVNDAYEFYTDETGSANRKWDIANDVILVADWTRHTYYIRIGADETFVWIGEDGISSTETSIEYGSLFDSASNLENNMNIENVSLKEGHKFQYFELSNGVRFEQWSQLAALYENGATVELTAVFEKEKNFIIRYLNGEFPLLVGDYGDPIELEVQEDLPGYKFSHWSVAPISEASGNERFIGTPFAPGEKFDYDTMPDLSYGVEEDLVVLYLQAVQEKIYSQVQLKAIYSKVTPNTVILEYGENFELPVPEPVDGREFLGWCVSEENRGAIAILGIQITDENGQCIAPWQYEEDIVLEAAWHTIAYRIIYDLDGGYFIGGSAERNWYMVDDEFLLSKPIKAGSEFKGWKNVKTGNIMSKIPKGLKGDVRLIAQWSKHCIITFDYR